MKLAFDGFITDNKNKAWWLIYGFIALVWMPVANYIVFRHGWSNHITSWFWVILEPVLALVWAFLAGLPQWNVSRKRQALRVLTTYYVIFSLSATAIIYGWGMRPQNWYVIVIFYVIACFLPPFDQISFDMLYWRKEKEDTEIDMLRQERVHLRMAVENYRSAINCVYGGDHTAVALENAANASVERANELREKLANLF